MRPAFIEYTNGNPSGFVARVRELLDHPRPFPVGLRYTGLGSAGNPVVDLILDPKKSSVPMYCAIPPSPPRRENLARTSLPDFLATVLGSGISATPATKPTIPTPTQRPSRSNHTQPSTGIGETLSLF